MYHIIQRIMKDKIHKLMINNQRQEITLQQLQMSPGQILYVSTTIKKLILLLHTMQHAQKAMRFKCTGHHILCTCMYPTDIHIEQGFSRNFSREGRGGERRVVGISRKAHSRPHKCRKPQACSSLLHAGLLQKIMNVGYARLCTQYIQQSKF